MSYRWKPSASQRRAFAERMKDPDEKQAYEDRKVARREKKRASSQFDYFSAGGNYIPTEQQHNTAFKMQLSGNLTSEQSDAANMVMYGYVCQEKVPHDHIHIVNEWYRSQYNILLYMEQH